ncbi:MAG TPA: futalosine hydrolase [Nitrospiraceae bacterium]|nr:futalosine hydrolase [Nitrospiraceae bacterium]
MSKGFVLLISSIPLESEKISVGLKRVTTFKHSDKSLYKGKLSGCNILLINSGIGKINAGHAATAMIENYPVSSVICFGIGGAYPSSGLGIGDIAVASKEIYGDEGVITSKGWSDIKEIGIPLFQKGRKRYFNEFPLDKKMVACAVSFFHLVSRHSELVEESLVTNIKLGPFVTVSTVSGSAWRAREMERRFNAICENMEGAAVAHVCAMYGIPMAEIRGISNIAGDRDKKKWDLKLAAENCQSVVLEFLKKI